MASLLKILWLIYLASQGLITVRFISKTRALPVYGTVNIDGSSQIGTTDEDFICATMDLWPPSKCDYGTCSWGNASLLNIDLSNKILLNAIRAFSPLKLRLGGTLQDNIRYQTRDDQRPCTDFVKKRWGLFGFAQGCLSIARWDELNTFFMQSGAKVIFGLNAMTGRKIGSDGIARGAWDSKNSIDFIRETFDRGYIIHGWEFGNELSGRGVGARVLADQYASDVINLQELVRDIYNDYDKHPLVLAPGGYYNEDWYTDFLLDSAYFVQVVTHHIYNLGPGVDEHLIDKILNTSFLDQEAKVFSNLQTLLKNIETPVVDAWVGEAGGAYNSGRDLVTNAFVFSFWYLDQLGMSASYDTKTYCRQSLIGGNYGLLDTNTFVPNPDYYSALLWHRLMGTNVLSTSFTGPKNIRAYAHCSKISTGVTLLLINLDKSTAVQVVLSIKHGMHQKKTPASKHKQHTEYENVRDEYHLTAKGGNLQSRIMLLNGEEITLSSSGKIPLLEPKRVNDSEPITVAPLSILFARIPSIELPACK